jgi:nitrate reductase NapAB chaperone NapD
MLNLLPKDQKIKLTREYRKRFWVVAFSLLLAGEIISLILLAPSYITTQTRINILNSASSGLKVQNLNVESANLSNIVEQTNRYLTALDSSTTPTGVVAAVQKIVEIRGDSVKINSLFYKLNSNQPQIVVSGKAKSRQSLLDFAKRLKGLPGVVSADLPVSDFAKAQDIDFSINVMLSPLRP